MDSDRVEVWREADRLFGRWLERPDVERAAWLAGLPLPAQVRIALERLVAQHAVPETPPVFDLSGSGAGQAPIERNQLAGRRVGNWQLVEEIGRGGMSVVYRARRVGVEFEQFAAIKLLSVATLGSQGVARFEQERQVLARLRHPLIAALIDGGVTEDGSPFLVMSLIEGRDLGEYCADKALPWRERVRLVIDICEAVAHAHQNLLVHRDLKPANILVTAEGLPVLLDFGIAKLLDVDSRVTMTGQQPMTPAYAAPEQIRGEPATTATDVHALGVILRNLCKDVGALPSDLSNIIAMATRPEPERRYPDARSLGEDLRRLLSGHVVRATPESASYRLRAFLRRRRGWVAMAAAITILIVGGLFATFWQAHRAELQAQEALRQTERAEAVKGFLFSLFEAGRREQTEGEDLQVSDLVERGAARLEAFAPRPELHAEMATLLGHIDTTLGRHERAQGLFDAAAESAARSGEPKLMALAWNGMARLANAEGNSQQAVERYERVLAMQDAAAQRDPEIVASALAGWTYAMQNLGREVEAEQRIARELERPDVAWTPLQRGELLLSQSMLEEKPERKLELARQAQAAFGQAGGTFPQIELENALASAFDRLNQADQTFEHARRAAELTDRLYPGPTRQRARIHNNLGNSARRIGKLSDADKAYDVAESIYRKLGDDHSPAFAALLHNRGVLLRELGDLDGALRSLEQAHALAAEHFGAADRRTGRALRHVAWVKAEVRADPRADAEWRQALEIAKAASDPRDTHAMLLIGCDIALNLGRAEDAQKRLDEADALAGKAGFELPPNLTLFRQRLAATVYSMQSQQAAATDAFRSAVEMARSEGGHGTSHLWRIERAFAEHLLRTKQPDLAKVHFIAAHEALLALGGSARASAILELRGHLGRSDSSDPG